MSVRLSLIVPVYNEAASIPTLFENLSRLMTEQGETWECLFVDDGSTDGSLDVVKKLRQRDPRVRYLSLSRNFGHQIALTAGLDAAVGDATITLDADLQHPPAVIPELIKRWKEGYDVVYTVRTASTETGLFKRASSRLFYTVFRWLSQTDMPHDAADFRLLSRRATDTLKRIRERHRFLRGLVSWIGFNQIAVPYAAPARAAGASKYSLVRMIRLALDGVTSFTSAPLYLATFLGFTVSGMAFLHAMIVLYWRLFTDRTIPGWTSTVIIVLFLGGVQLICIGIMGEYVGKIYSEIKERPLYLIKESGGFDAPLPS